MNKFFLFIILLIFYSCSYNSINAKLETRNKFLEQREKLENLDSKSIGKDLEDIFNNLKQIITYDDLLKYVPRISYKSNIEILEVGNAFFLFTEDIWNEETKPSVQIRIKYIVKNDTIRYGQIVKISKDRLKLFDNLLFRLDTGFIERLLESHNKIYSSNQKIEDFLNAYRERNRITFACGNAGTWYGKIETKMLCEIEKGEINSIGKLLRSIDPINQAIGVIGLLKLQDAGYEINEDFLKYKDLILKSKQEFKACYGCGSKIVVLDEYIKLIDWNSIPNIKLKCTNSD